MRKRFEKTRLQRVANNEIKHRIVVETNVTEEMERRRLKWYGHVKRGDGTLMGQNNTRMSHHVDEKAEGYQKNG